LVCGAITQAESRCVGEPSAQFGDPRQNEELQRARAAGR
jgi:hypothetical protein